MYTVIKIEDVTKDQGTHIVFHTKEDFLINVQYRFGIILVSVLQEILYKKKLTTDYKDSKMEISDILEYLEAYLPDELLKFEKTEDHEKQQSEKTEKS